MARAATLARVDYLADTAAVAGLAEPSAATAADSAAREAEDLAGEGVGEAAAEGETSATSIPASRTARSPGTGRLRTSTRSHSRCWDKNRINPSTGPITSHSRS